MSFFVISLIDKHYGGDFFISRLLGCSIKKVNLKCCAINSNISVSYTRISYGIVTSNTFQALIAAK